MTTYTHVPNSYQKPNVFADELMRLLSPTQNMVLDATCRQIMGWETKRAARRDRISLSQFQALTGLSRPTIMSALAHLATANILTPVGQANGRTQEHELNLGQRGDYRWDFLRDHAPARWNPEQARAAKQSPDMAVRGGLVALPPDDDDRSRKADLGGQAALPEPVKPLDTPNSLNSKRELEIDSLWSQALRVLRARLLPLTYEDWIATARLEASTGDGSTLAHRAEPSAGAGDALPGGVRLVFRRAEAPNTRAWLETHLAPLLREALAPYPIEFGFTHPFTGE
jgi:hypothetical protein